MSNTMKTSTLKNDIPNIEKQIEESITNLKAGNYKTFTIPEYRKELIKRFGENLDN